MRTGLIQRAVSQDLVHSVCLPSKGDYPAKNVSYQNLRLFVHNSAFLQWLARHHVAASELLNLRLRAGRS